MLVSIVIPTKDRPDWLPRAVESVVAQTSPGWELVVLDNARTAGYRAADFPDKRIRYMHERCDGVADAYNRAISHAKGDVIVPLGDDDQLPDHVVGLINETFADPDVLWANAITVIQDPDGHEIAVRGGDQASIDRTRAGEYWLGGAVWWRRDLTDGALEYDSRFDGAADFDLYLRFLERADPALVPAVGYLYTDWPGTDSRRRAGVQQAHSATIAHEWHARSANG